MLCEKCGKNEATVFYREVINGKEKKYTLCSSCAAKLEKESGFELDALGDFFDDYNPISDLFSSLFNPSYLLTNNKKTKRCSLCGSSFDDLVENGKVGCSKCYEVFEQELLPSINRLHGKTKHIGKMPKKLKHDDEAKKLINSLETDMKAAIKAQEFEKAAEIRDRLRELRSENG